MNELIYQQGGVLILDEPWPEQPTSATITIRTLNNAALSSMSNFADIEDEACTVDDLIITLPATNAGAKVFTPTETSGAIGDLTNDGYRMLLSRGGRKHYVRVAEYDSDGINVNSVRFSAAVPFAVSAGDSVYGLRVSYEVDWSSVTSTFVGQVKAVWKVTVGGVERKIVRIYDVVKQVLLNPATWSDVLAMRPDANDQLSEVSDKEVLVQRAWDTVKQDLYTLGIRFNLIVPDGSTTLKDAVVYQTLYNLTQHQSLPVPRSFEGQGEAYLDRLQRDKDRALSQLQMPVDENEDEIVSTRERGTSRKAVYFRSVLNKRQRT